MPLLLQTYTSELERASRTDHNDHNSNNNRKEGERIRKGKTSEREREGKKYSNIQTCNACNILMAD